MWNNKISAIAIHSYYLQIRNIVYRQFHEKLLISQNKNFIFIRLWARGFPQEISDWDENSSGCL